MNLLNVAGAVDSSAVKLDDLNAHVSALQQAIDDFRFLTPPVLTLICIVLTLVGLGAFFGIKVYITRSVKKRIKKDILSEFAQIKMENTALGARLREAILAASSVANLLILSGDIEASFNDQGYAQGIVGFETAFPGTPQVFVCEGKGGQWVFSKIDEKHPDRFAWAATNLTAGAPTRATIIQWVAIYTKPKIDQAKIKVAPPTKS